LKRQIQTKLSPLLFIEIALSPTRTEVIKFYAGDDPEKIVRDFCKKNKLNDGIYQSLVNRLYDEINGFTEDTNLKSNTKINEQSPAGKQKKGQEESDIISENTEEDAESCCTREETSEANNNLTRTHFNHLNSSTNTQQKEIHEIPFIQNDYECSSSPISSIGEHLENPFKNNIIKMKEYRSESETAPVPSKTMTMRKEQLRQSTHELEN